MSDTLTKKEHQEIVAFLLGSKDAELSRLRGENEALKRKHYNDLCRHCPECGSYEQGHDGGLEKSHRYCKDCGQEWFTDISYESMAQGNAKKLTAAESESASLREKVKELDTLEKKHHDAMLTEQGLRVMAEAQVAELREKVANMVHRGRVEAMEKEVADAEAKTKKVQEQAGAEIAALSAQVEAMTKALEEILTVAKTDERFSQHIRRIAKRGLGLTPPADAAPKPCDFCGKQKAEHYGDDCTLDFNDDRRYRAKK